MPEISERSTEAAAEPTTAKKDAKISTFQRTFKNLTGYKTKEFSSFANLTKWLHRPVDASALGVFRMFYGAVMLIDLAEERSGSQLDVRFGEPQHCHFPLFDGIRAASLPIMGCIYLCMWFGAIGIMLGYRFRISCLAYVVPYWYIFLLDKPAWNNHSYLFGLVGSMLLFSHANRYCSLDKYLQPSLPSTVPYWNYFLIKFQFFLLYMYAGLKKFSAEWLSGYAMSSLSRHWLFVPVRLLLSAEMIDLLIVHWFTAVFDFSIAFFMTWERTRVLATPFMLSFHLLNSRLFIIGMFPWVCVAEVPLFYGFDWPRKLELRKRLEASNYSITDNELKKRGNAAAALEVAPTVAADSDVVCMHSKHNSANTKSSSTKLMCACCRKSLKQRASRSKSAQLRTALILAYCGLQLFLPYSHFITKGYNNWTDGLYGYSWNMMVHSYDTILTSIKIVDNSNGNVHYLDPYAFTDFDRWTKYADMALQYAKCIESKILVDHAKHAQQSPLTSTNISIYFDIWCSMNGRFQQRVFDPRVDLLRAQWSPFERTPWSLPLLNELNHMRPKLKTIADEVLNWNNYSDVVFVADFPGLTLDNFISPDLTNVSLTILEGNVRYKSDEAEESYFLTAGKTFSLQGGVTHHVTTIGSKPSSYLYTYVNKTMLDQEMLLDESKQQLKSLLPLWQEFKERLVNYEKFLAHMGNCVLFLLYDVPIPIAVRERN